MNKNWLSAMCFIGAAIVAASGHDGWGWLLFVGLIIQS